MIPNKLAALVVVVVMAMLPDASLAQDAAAAPITTGDPEADAVIREIESFTAEVIEARDRLHSDRLNPEALLEAIGSEPDAILEWVTESTRWLPYKGALRGARGVLMDRSGSSLDRALLLAELLSTSGADVRLASTRLPDSTAAELAARELARPWTIDTEPFFATTDEVAAFRADVASAAAELAADIGLSSGATAMARSQDSSEAVADHWWVQTSSGEDWIDYDPLFPAEAAGRPPAEATMDPAAIPDELRHEVTVRVVIERAEGGALVEEIPLEHAVLMGTDEPLKALELRFAVDVSVEFAEQASETTDVTEAAQLSAYWRPALDLGDGTIWGEWFSAAGQFEAPARAAQADALSTGLDALGGLGANPGDPEMPNSHLSATWIEYETSGPGLETQTQRRQLLDLAGVTRDGEVRLDEGLFTTPEAVVGRGLAFLGESTILLQSATPHPDAVLDAYLENWIELRPAMIALAFMKAGVDDERIGPSLSSPDFTPVDLLAMASARSRWAVSPDTYVGRPNIWSRHLSVEPKDGDPASSVAVDVVSNDVAVLPGTSRDPNVVRLEQGILDTLVEHALPGATESLNTWDRFHRRDSEGVEWTVLRPGVPMEDGVADALPGADVARMRDALADGDTVVVATVPRLRGDEPFADWWRIAADGTALGMGYRGWGSEFVEEDITLEISMNELGPLLRADHTRWIMQLEGEEYVWVARSGWGRNAGLAETFHSLLSWFGI